MYRKDKYLPTNTCIYDTINIETKLGKSMIDTENNHIQNFKIIQ